MPFRKRQAVLLIHGIGEQRPMDTLRGFVKAVWDDDALAHHNFANKGKGERWSKPDDISGNYELRCLTTSKNMEGTYTDFYEYYWAHLMEGNKIVHVIAWLNRLVWRVPWKLPKPLRGLWFLLVLFGIGALFLLFNWVKPGTALLSNPMMWGLSLGGGVLLAGFISIFKNIVGDAARYLDPSPKNIKKRQEIRAKGIDILKKLHDSGKYQRIIVVGHSLGTFIAYDILSQTWHEYNNGHDPEKEFPALDEMETMLKEPVVDTKAFRTLQQKVYQEQLDNGGRWLVSDLITLGSPLTYADLLAAENKADLQNKQQERELPTCPPVLDDDQRITYGGKRKFNIAAVFGPTRWTNIYFPPRYTLFGDIISGPLQPLFGAGISDIPVKTSISGGIFSHTRYWTLDNQRKAADQEVLAALKKFRKDPGEDKRSDALSRFKANQWKQDVEDTDDHILQLRKAVQLVDQSLYKTLLERLGDNP
jgi:hypothetical protein